ncbi:hypothetical protein NF552_26105 (plasmid) [Roseomonas mucosa]|nr:hypothetical protein NF552_26105 [Roseomonas mucosa]
MQTEPSITSRHANAVSRHRETGTILSSGKPGTIPVTVRLEPARYDRLKQLVRRLATTGQSLITEALDRRMAVLERSRAEPVSQGSQSTLFEPVRQEGLNISRRPAQPLLPFSYPDATIATGYRASVPMHRWLQRQSQETGMSIRQIIDNALKAAGGPS